MQYIGGKTRTANVIAPIIQKYVDVSTGYIEPFVGGANIMRHMRHAHRTGYDASEALITLYNALQNGHELPSVITEREYQELKRDQDPRNPLTAFVGFGCSFSGKWFGGYARDNTGRNYALNAKNSLLNKMRTLNDVVFLCSDYSKIVIPDGAVVYCDPPYQGTTQYGAVGDFDTSEFWGWCRKVSQKATVIVSEYSAPDGIECVLEAETKTDIRNAAGQKDRRIEKLFLMRS